MTKLERVEKALEVAMGTMTALLECKTGHAQSVHAGGMAGINAILRPEPQYENVTVSHWKGWNSKGDLIYDEDHAPEVWSPDFPLVELKGAVRRAIPQPVERTAKITLTAGGWSLDSAIKGDPPYYGTFTWTDPQ